MKILALTSCTKFNGDYFGKKIQKVGYFFSGKTWKKIKKIDNTKVESFVSMVAYTESQNFS